LPQQRIEEFVQHARDFVAASYSGLDSPEYSSIVDQQSFDRLMSALDDALASGARVEALMPGPAFDRATHRIAPHVVLGLTKDSLLIRGEILGPILALRAYASLDEVIAQINAGPRPPVIYPLSCDGAKVEMLIERVMSGEVSVDARRLADEYDLPFGGAGELRMGHYRGRAGVERFSRMRRISGRARFGVPKLNRQLLRWLADRMRK
jgi:coniferyl-aldehyde dehydrogenase